MVAGAWGGSAAGTAEDRDERQVRGGSLKEATWNLRLGD